MQDGAEINTKNTARNVDKKDINTMCVIEDPNA